MLDVYFENVITRHRMRLAPRARLRTVGTSLFDGQDTALASYEQGMWRVGDAHFFVIGMDSPTLIHFENAELRSAPIGPFNPVWLVSGAIRAGERQEMALARLDEHRGAWHVYADRTFWSTAVFLPAA